MPSAAAAAAPSSQSFLLRATACGRSGRASRRSRRASSWIRLEIAASCGAASATDRKQDERWRDRSEQTRSRTCGSIAGRRRSASTGCDSNASTRATAPPRSWRRAPCQACSRRPPSGYGSPYTRPVRRVLFTLAAAERTLALAGRRRLEPALLGRGDAVAAPGPPRRRRCGRVGTRLRRLASVAGGHTTPRREGAPRGVPRCVRGARPAARRRARAAASSCGGRSARGEGVVLMLYSVLCIHHASRSAR